MTVRVGFCTGAVGAKRGERGAAQESTEWAASHSVFPSGMFAALQKSLKKCLQWVGQMVNILTRWFDQPENGRLAQGESTTLTR